MRTSIKSSAWLVPAIAIAVFAMGSGAALAARVSPRISVSVDGKPALSAYGGRHGDRADNLWLSLKKAQFEQVPKRPRVSPYRVEADQDNPLQATLKGKIVITVEEGGRADVAELKLVRENETARWMIAPEEVDRTLKNRHKPFLIAVSIDGNPELSTGLVTRAGSTPDDPDNVWKSLQYLEVIPIRGQKLHADADDPAHATLRGNIVIEVTYDKRPWGRVEVSELRLVPQKAQPWRWKVDPSEVARALESRTRPQSSQPAP